MYSVSVIMTAFQAEKTIGKAIESVLNTHRNKEIEIIVVDDCSTDKTCAIICDYQNHYSNIKLFKMNKNSGGPSAPRNLGIGMATGEYITFLDDDDEIVSDNLLDMVEYLKKRKADFGKGYLLTIDGEKKSITNKIPGKIENKINTIKTIVAVQSMTSDIIVSRELLLKYDLKYRTGIKIGEDTAFTIDILTRAENPMYINNYFLVYHKNPISLNNLSSTQNISDREICDQITSWENAQKQLSTIGLDYYKLRLPAAFRNLLVSIVRFSNGITEETYIKLHNFSCETKKLIKDAMHLSKRYEELYQAILSGDYKKYQYFSKRRLLISGTDLKFILPLVKYFEKDYVVQIDEWKGHNLHDEEKSKQYAEWADIFWCEWLLGNAVYYSKIKNSNQRLVIRAHKFELYREFGHQINWDKVDMVFAVGYYTYEQFIKTFGIPRWKMRLLSNFVEESIYNIDKNLDARYHIGLVGAIPKMKGLMKALELLTTLRRNNPKFKLYIMGKFVDEVPWVKNNPVEKEYFDNCQEYIRTHNLDQAVIFGGHKDRECLFDNIGYVLSLSDNERPESFHLAPVEGACAGCRSLILKWSGAEFIFPKWVIYDTMEDICAEIIKSVEDVDYNREQAKKFREYVLNNFSIERIYKEILEHMLYVRIGG